jgi:3-oxoadipate enol-lactonase
MAVLPLAGADLHFEVNGRGVPVVVVHGYLLDARMWDEQVDALAGELRLVRYDVRGFGRSPRDDTTPYTHAQDLWSLLDHLEIPAALLVGSSMGGQIALEAALLRPERAAGLVLLDPVVDGVPWDEEAAAGMSAVTDAFREGGAESARAAWLAHPLFRPARRDPILARRLEEMVAGCPDSHWTAPDPHGRHPETLRLLSTVLAPTHVVVGELDVPGFHAMADTVARSIPAARSTVLPGVGHMVGMESPDEVAEIVRTAVSRSGRGLG